MGDSVLRISLLVQRGYLCQTCADVVDGGYHHKPRKCESCRARKDASRLAVPEELGNWEDGARMA